MIDIGISKLLIIAGVALIVIGPKRLPATAKAIGILLTRMQRYIAKLKQEVNQHVNLDEIHSLKYQAMQAGEDFQNSLHDINNSFNLSNMHTDLHITTLSNVEDELSYKNYQKQNNGRYSWRLKRNSMPLWYKQKHHIRPRIQNGAARMKRFQYKRNIKQYFWF